MVAGNTPSHPTIDASYIEELVSAAAAAGVDIDRLLERSGIDPQILKEPHARLSQRQFASMLSHLTRATRDEFWLHGSRPIKIGTFQQMCHLLLQARTLREAIRSACHFYHLVTDDFTVRLLETDDEGILTVVDHLVRPTKRPIIHGTILLFSFGLMSWLVGRRVPVNTVRNAFHGGSLTAELELVYRAPILNDRARSELRFPAAFLDQPILPDADRLAQYLKTLPGALVVRFHDRSSFADRVKGILRRNLTEPISFEDVAALLAISPQTLRRRLHDELGQGFQEIRDSVRRDMAIQLLEKSELTMEDIGSAIGFAEVSTFYRAFKRWSGFAPGHFRATKRTGRQSRNAAIGQPDACARRA